MDSGEKMTAEVSASAKQGEQHEQAKRAYEPPRLRHLGSVRVLTLGATGRRNDVTGGKRAVGPSSREFKENIHYLTPDERTALASQVLGLKLATYDYRPEMGESEGRHLGFIIEDAPSAPFVRPEEKVVDVYGFTSALAAVVQEQQATIRRLSAELAELKAKLPV